MSLAKTLTEDQISTIRRWAEEGDTFADIQAKLGTELAVKITYLETRFLLEDLQIQLLPEPRAEEAQEEEAVESPDPEAPGEEEPPTDGGVRVSVDQVLRPGALISGQVDFGGGQTAGWWLDQMGRLSLDPADREFRPTEEQAMAFQEELRAAIRKSGL